MDTFTARVQRNLSYLVIGGVLLLIVISGTGLVQIPESMLTKLFDAAFLVVLLYWFQRQREPSASLPPEAVITPPASPQPKEVPNRENSAIP